MSKRNRHKHRTHNTTTMATRAPSYTRAVHRIATYIEHEAAFKRHHGRVVERDVWTLDDCRAPAPVVLRRKAIQGVPRVVRNVHTVGDGDILHVVHGQGAVLDDVDLLEVPVPRRGVGLPAAATQVHAASILDGQPLDTRQLAVHIEGHAIHNEVLREHHLALRADDHVHHVQPVRGGVEHIMPGDGASVGVHPRIGHHHRHRGRRVADGPLDLHVTSVRHVQRATPVAAQLLDVQHRARRRCVRRREGELRLPVDEHAVELVHLAPGI